VRDGWALLAVSASHRVGFVRQEALEQLRQRGDGRAVPFLVMRLNDWVVQVRRTAQAALSRYLLPGFAPFLVAALPLVLALERQRRGEHATMVAAILDLLRSDDCREALSTGCGSPDRELRRACYRIALGDTGEDAGLVEQALGDRDPAIRLWAVRRAGQRLDRPWAPGLVYRALSDRSVQVRRVALGLLADALPSDEAGRLLEAALLDDNTSARWQARMLRIRRGPIDLADFYRTALAEARAPARLRGALLGLGESGTAADIAAVTAHLGADPTSVRRAAVRALSGLEADSSTQPFLAALVDPLPGISKEARRALLPRLRYLPIQVLADLIASDRAPHVRGSALALASALSKWDALPLLLEGGGASAPEVAARAGLLLRGWLARYNKSFPLPTPAQVERIEAVWGRVAAAVPASGELGQIVRLARRLAER
jgi:HEAT repeat protein